MSVSMVGLTHRNTSLGLFERVTVRDGERGPLLVALREGGCREAVVVSTCSRTEVYAVGDVGPHRLTAVLAAHCGLAPDELHAVAEPRHGLTVADHLFRVTGGLSSRVIGEVEIHGQVRAALREAQAHGTSGPTLDRLFARALQCGRRIREETSLGAQGRSLARRAVEVGLAAVPLTTAPVVVVVGAGRMAGVAVEHLVANRRQPIVVAREPERAARMAAPANRRSMDDLIDVLRSADLVICATSAAHDVVTLGHVRAATSCRAALRPLTLVDVSVPRNVDTAVASLPGVRLVDLESLNDDTTRDPALAAALQAGGAVVGQMVQRYADDVASAPAGPVIAAMREAVRRTCREELAKVAGLAGVDDDELARLAHAVTGKILHRPVLAARAAAAAGDQVALDGLRALFAESATARIPTPRVQ